MENGGSSEDDQATYRLMVWNVGMLQFRMGPFRYEPVPYVQERLQAVPRALFESGADGVMLQELMDERDRRFVIESTRDFLPFVAHDGGTSGGLRKGSGLVILSRHPILSSKFVPYTDAPWEEGLVMEKGVLRARIASPVGTVCLHNTHAAAGGIGHPEHARCDRIRARQLQELAATANVSEDNLVLIGGDLNAGPQASPENYRTVLREGFVDTYNAFFPGGAPFADVDWDPQNALNDGGPHTTSPPQRITHILAKRSCWGRFRVTSASITQREPCVPVANGRLVTISDHAAVCVDFTR